MKKLLVEKYASEFKEESLKSAKPGVLKTIKGAVTGWKENRNGRTYSRELWNNAINSEYVKSQMALKQFFGEADHPEDRLEVCFEGVSHNITDMWFEDSTSELWAKIDILDTPKGNILNKIFEYSGHLSFSTRGTGDVDSQGNVDPDTYQLFAIDAVCRPSYASATASEITESEDLKEVSEEDIKSILKEYSSADDKESLEESEDIINILIQEKLNERENLIRIAETL